MRSDNAKGPVQVRLDSGRAVAFFRESRLHLDYGYAVTSHSSQGQTADRVLVDVDTERAGEALVNRRFAYVALSRSPYDPQSTRTTKPVLQSPSIVSRHIGPRSSPLSKFQRARPRMKVTASATRTIGRGIGH